MKMKKNENVSDLDIDKILTEKYDLGFLLDQIKNKNNHHTYWLPIVDVLRFIPQFNETVEQIRNCLQINTTVINKNLCQLYGIDDFLQFLTISKDIGRGINFPDPDDIKIKWPSISTEIYDWKQRNYPTLSVKVTTLRLKVLGKAPHTWQEAIEDYILFEKISSTPLIYRRSIPEVSVKKDSKTSESYLEIKIYSDTDISILQKISWWKKIQKTLPAYTDPREWDEQLLLSRFLQYVLRKHLKLTQKETSEWLNGNNLPQLDNQYSSQEVARFERLFTSTPRK